MMDFRETCPKCKAYIQRTYEWDDGDYESGKLVCRCTECGYMWEMKTADEPCTSPE